MVEYPTFCKVPQPHTCDAGSGGGGRGQEEQEKRGHTGLTCSPALPLQTACLIGLSQGSTEGTNKQSQALHQVSEELDFNVPSTAQDNQTHSIIAS